MFSRAFEKYLWEEKLAGSMGRNDMRNDMTDSTIFSVSFILTILEGKNTL